MMNHMMSDPMVAMMLLLGLVLLLGIGFVCVRVYGGHQRQAAPARPHESAETGKPRSLEQ